MKTISFGVLIAAAMVAAALPVPARQTEPAPVRNWVKVSIEGELVAGEKTPESGSSGMRRFSKLALRVNRAVKDDGTELPELNGQVLSIVHNSKSRRALKSHQTGDRLSVKVRVNVDEKLLKFRVPVNK